MCIWYKTETTDALSLCLVKMPNCSFSHRNKKGGDPFLTAEFFHVTHFLILLQAKLSGVDGSFLGATPPLLGYELPV